MMHFCKKKIPHAKTFALSPYFIAIKLRTATSRLKIKKKFLPLSIFVKMEASAPICQ